MWFNVIRWEPHLLSSRPFCFFWQLHWFLPLRISLIKWYERERNINLRIHNIRRSTWKFEFTSSSCELFAFFDVLHDTKKIKNVKKFSRVRTHYGLEIIFNLSIMFAYFKCQDHHVFTPMARPINWTLAWGQKMLIHLKFNSTSKDILSSRTSFDKIVLILWWETIHLTK